MMRNLGQQRKLQHKESAYEALRKDNLKKNRNCRKSKVHTVSNQHRLYDFFYILLYSRHEEEITIYYQKTIHGIVRSPLLKPLLKKTVYQGRRNQGARGRLPRPQICAVNPISIRGCKLCPLAPPPGFSDLPTALMQEKKRREVNVGNNRDVHQVSMHSGRTRQKLICHRLKLQCIACSKMPKPVHTVHQWFLQLTNL